MSVLGSQIMWRGYFCVDDRQPPQKTFLDPEKNLFILIGVMK